MKLTIRRINELTGSKALLDVYINNQMLGKIPAKGELTINCQTNKAEVYVKTSWCESNRIVVTTDSNLVAYARGGLIGATINALLQPKKTYILKIDE